MEMNSMKNFRVENIMLPKAEIGGLVVAFILQRFVGILSLKDFFLASIIGWLLLSAGILLNGWAVFEADTMNIKHPSRLIMDGAYCKTRNPMLIGWMALYLGVSFIFDLPWAILLFPLVFIYNQNIDIKNEEQQLLKKFGPAYEEYCKRVPRYF
jgi:protein-S-isoprenylcysteine O-methyltransferase Ste14